MSRIELTEDKRVEMAVAAFNLAQDIEQQLIKHWKTADGKFSSTGFCLTIALLVEFAKERSKRHGGDTDERWLAEVQKLALEMTSASPLPK